MFFDTLFDATLKMKPWFSNLYGLSYLWSVGFKTVFLLNLTRKLSASLSITMHGENLWRSLNRIQNFK
jgi:hypothetical protein